MRSRAFARRLVAVALSAMAAVATVTTTDNAVAATSTSDNPLAGHKWGIYTGASDGLYPAYEQASGSVRTALGQEALRPHVRWYTRFIPASEVGSRVAADIASEQQGNANTVVWMATFGLWPYHESAKSQPLTQADQDAYKRWVDNVAHGIGSSAVALIVEPDLPVSLTGWRPSVRLSLVRYAMQEFSSLPRAAVYLDGGSADWLKVPDEVSMLEKAGIRYARGFSLGSTHHTGLVREIRYGRAVATSLGSAGYGFKHFIIDTSDNGHGYTNRDFWAAHPSGDVNDPPACTTLQQKVCVSLGVPPTTDVTNSRWGVPSYLAPVLQRRCDAFAWIARPWMAANGGYFSQSKAVDIVHTDPYFN